jgi:Spy/CpxP family protein refolding chaperone
MGMPMSKGGMADDKMGSMPNSTAAPMKDRPTATARMTEAPHLLHIGAKDFFLDHQQHLGITPDQKAQLETIKNDASNQKSASQGEIDKAQQQLWQLTSAAQPNSADIDSKVQEVAQLRAVEQVAFIHSVSAASNVLTPEQRVEAVKPMTPAKGSMSKMPKAPMKME